MTLGVSYQSPFWKNFHELLSTSSAKSGAPVTTNEVLTLPPFVESSGFLTSLTSL